ncbi:MAG TPA: polysaccharide biosynthesis/export family protein [Candidatus Omnitrophota bacterium]|nr:polysaccharide biosynthesis/export family protein [Candidatus Omnitrophota bacterium]
MPSKFLPILTLSLSLLLGSFLTLAKAEEKLKGQPIQPVITQEQPKTSAVQAAAPTTTVKSEPAPAAAPAPKPAATLEKAPQKGAYTLAIPSDIPGYDTKTTPSDFDPVKYTLGADDIIEITVMRHPEFSGIFPINSEGKVQYKFVGDIDVKGMTKKQVEDKLVKALSNYLVNPEVSVTITEYRSKFVFVLGEVGQPGKYYIKSDTITVRDAVVNSGLPTYSAAMRKCSLITPDKSGKIKNRPVNIYAILYIGDLRKNIEMHPGDVLYVPSTVMAKIIRIISPVATTVGLASSPADSTSSAKTAAKTLAL